MLSGRGSPGQLGFTLLELLVCTSLMLMITGMFGTVVIATKNLQSKDTIRTRANQDLRSLFDIIGSEVRLAGEKLNPSFPAILLENGIDDAPDRLTLRRNLLDEVLPLCNTVGPPSQATQSNLFFTLKKEVTTHPISRCLFLRQSTAYQKWLTYWQDDLEGGTGQAYLYHRNNKSGDFFDFKNVITTGNSSNNERYKVTAENFNWSQRYNRNSGEIYILEEWQLSVSNNNRLQLISGSEQALPIDLAQNVSDFQVRITMSDGSVVQSFSKNDRWTDIRDIEIELATIDPKSEKEERWQTNFFPRNILSDASYAP